MVPDRYGYFPDMAKQSIESTPPQKNPGGEAAGAVEFSTSISRSRSWIEVVLDPQDAGPNMGR
jgi:hypothetical protein